MYENSVLDRRSLKFVVEDDDRYSWRYRFESEDLRRPRGHGNSLANIEETYCSGGHRWWTHVLARSDRLKGEFEFSPSFDRDRMARGAVRFKGALTAPREPKRGDEATQVLW